MAKANWNSSRFIGLDLETGDSRLKNPPILSLAMQQAAYNEQSGEYDPVSSYSLNYLINPTPPPGVSTHENLTNILSGNIPVRGSKTNKTTIGGLTGLTVQDFAGAENPADVAKAAWNYLFPEGSKDRPTIFGHNVARYDIPLLDKFLHANLPPEVFPANQRLVDRVDVIDTLQMARQATRSLNLDPSTQPNALENVAPRFGINPGQSHTALADVVTSRRLLAPLYRAIHGSEPPSQVPPSLYPARGIRGEFLTETVPEFALQRQNNPVQSHTDRVQALSGANLPQNQSPNPGRAAKAKATTPKNIVGNPPGQGGPPMQPPNSSSSYLGGGLHKRAPMALGQSTMTADEIHKQIVGGLTSLKERGIIDLGEEVGIGERIHITPTANHSYILQLASGEEPGGGIQMEVKGGYETGYASEGQSEKTLRVVTGGGSESIVGSFVNFQGDYDPMTGEFQQTNLERLNPAEHFALMLANSVQIGAQEKLRGPGNVVTSQMAFQALLGSEGEYENENVRRRVPGGALNVAHNDVQNADVLGRAYSQRLGLVSTRPEMMPQNTFINTLNRAMGAGLRDQHQNLRGVRFQKPDTNESLYGKQPTVTARGYRLLDAIRYNQESGQWTGYQASDVKYGDPNKISKGIYAQGKINPLGAVQPTVFPVVKGKGGVLQRPWATDEYPTLGPRIPSARYQYSNMVAEEGMQETPEFTDLSLIVSGKIYAGASIYSQSRYKMAGIESFVQDAPKTLDLPIVTNLKDLTTKHLVGDSEKGKAMPLINFSLRKNQFGKMVSVGGHRTAFTYLSQDDTGNWLAPKENNVVVSNQKSRFAITGMQLNIPEFMDEANKPLYNLEDIFESPDSDALRKGVYRTDDIANDLREMYKDYNGLVTVQQSRIRAPSITINQLREEGGSPKGGIKTQKAGPMMGIENLGMQLDPNDPFSAGIMKETGMNFLPVSEVTGDVKQPLRALMSGIQHMPRSQQADFFSIMPGTENLQEFIKGTPEDQPLPWSTVTQRYFTEQRLRQVPSNKGVVTQEMIDQGLRGTDPYSPIEMMQQYFNKLDIANPTEDAVSRNTGTFQRFGIGRVAGWTKLVSVSDETRMMYQTRERARVAGGLSEELLGYTQARAKRPAGAIGVGTSDWYRNGKPDMSYAQSVLPEPVFQALSGLKGKRFRSSYDAVTRRLDEEARKTLRFTPNANDKNFMVSQYFDALAAPTAVQYRPEYAGNIRLGYESVFAVASQFPGLASKMGFLPGQGPWGREGELGSPSDKAWVNTLAAYSLREEAKRQGGTGFEVPTGGSIVDLDQGFAEDLYALVGKTESTAGLGELQEKISKAYRARYDKDLPENAIFRARFKSETGEKTEYIPSPGTIQNIDYPEVGGGSSAYWPIMYSTMLENTIGAASEPGDMGYGTQAETSINRFWSRFSKDALAHKSSVERTMFGKTPQVGFSSHFMPMGELGPQEAFASPDRAQLLAKQMGFRTVNQLYKWMDKQGGSVPGSFFRTPQLSRHSLPMRLLSENALKARGVDPNKLKSPLTAGGFWVHPSIANVTIGDWDEDPFGFFLHVRKGEQGPEVVHDQAVEDMLSMDAKMVEERNKQWMTEMVGPEGAMKYDVMSLELRDRAEGFEGVMGKIKRGGRLTMGEFDQAMETKRLNDTIKGSSYQTMRKLEAFYVAGQDPSTDSITAEMIASAGASGDASVLTDAMKSGDAYKNLRNVNRISSSMTKLYQRGLDLLVPLQEGLSPIEKVFGGGGIRTGTRNGAMETTWYTKPGQKNLVWSSAGGENKGIARILKGYAGLLGESLDTPNEAIAAALGYADKDDKTFNTILGRLNEVTEKYGEGPEAKYKEKRRLALTRLVDEGVINARATAVRAATGMAAYNFIKKNPDMASVAMLPYWKQEENGRIGTQTISAEELLAKPDIGLGVLSSLVSSGDLTGLVQAFGLRGTSRLLAGRGTGTSLTEDQLVMWQEQMASITGVNPENLQAPVELSGNTPDSAWVALNRKGTYDPSNVNLRVNASAAYASSMSSPAAWYEEIPGTNRQTWSKSLMRTVIGNLLGEDVANQGIMSTGKALDIGKAMEERAFPEYEKMYAGQNQVLGHGTGWLGNERNPSALAATFDTRYGKVTYLGHPDVLRYASDKGALFIEDFKSHAVKQKELDVIKAKQGFQTNQQALEWMSKDPESLKRFTENKNYIAQVSLYRAGLVQSMAEYKDAYQQAQAIEGNAALTPEQKAVQKADVLARMDAARQKFSTLQEEGSIAFSGLHPNESGDILLKNAQGGLSIGTNIVPVFTDESGTNMAIGTPQAVKPMTREELTAMAERQIGSFQSALETLPQAARGIQIYQDEEQMMRAVDKNWKPGDPAPSAFGFRASFAGAQGPRTMSWLMSAREKLIAGRTASPLYNPFPAPPAGAAGGQPPIVPPTVPPVAGGAEPPEPPGGLGPQGQYNAGIPNQNDILQGILEEIRNQNRNGGGGPSGPSGGNFSSGRGPGDDEYRRIYQKFQTFYKGGENQVSGFDQILQQLQKTFNTGNREDTLNALANFTTQNAGQGPPETFIRAIQGANGARTEEQLARVIMDMAPAQTEHAADFYKAVMKLGVGLRTGDSGALDAVQLDEDRDTILRLTEEGTPENLAMRGMGDVGVMRKYLRTRMKLKERGTLSDARAAVINDIYKRGGFNIAEGIQQQFGVDILDPNFAVEDESGQSGFKTLLEQREDVTQYLRQYSKGTLKRLNKAIQQSKQLGTQGDPESDETNRGLENIGLLLGKSGIASEALQGDRVISGNFEERLTTARAEEAEAYQNFRSGVPVSAAELRRTTNTRKILELQRIAQQFRLDDKTESAARADEKIEVEMNRQLAEERKISIEQNPASIAAGARAGESAYLSAVGQGHLFRAAQSNPQLARVIARQLEVQGLTTQVHQVDVAYGKLEAELADKQQFGGQPEEIADLQQQMATNRQLRSNTIEALAYGGGNKPLSSATIRELEELSKASDKTAEAVKKHIDVLNDHTKTQKEVTESEKKLLGVRREEQLLGERAKLREAFGAQYGEVSTEREAQRRIGQLEDWAKGGARPAWLAGEGVAGDEDKVRIAGLVKQRAGLADTELGIAAAGRAEWKASEADKADAGFGGFARKMFGGFGLMYLRSIGGLMTQGAYTGLGERMQAEQQIATPLAQMGLGGMPQTPQERQQRVLASMYGGQGGMALTDFRTSMMQNQPGLFNLGGIALTGVSAGGLAEYALPGLFKDIPEKQIGRAAIGIGAAAAFGAEALNIYGAYKDVPGTATALAARRLRGENLYQPNWAAIGTSAVSGAILGSTIGTPGVGTVVGAIAGTALGFGADFKVVAATLNPEIKRQEAIISEIASGKSSVSQVLSKYGIDQNQTAYYARLGVMADLTNPAYRGIPEGVLGQVAAYGAKWGQGMSSEEIVRMSDNLMAGLDTEKAATQALSIMGYNTKEQQEIINKDKVGKVYTERPYDILGAEKGPGLEVKMPVTKDWLGIESKGGDIPVPNAVTASVSSSQFLVPVGEAQVSPQTLTTMYNTALQNYFGAQQRAGVPLQLAQERWAGALTATGKMGVLGTYQMPKFEVGERDTDTLASMQESISQAEALGSQYEKMQNTGWADLYTASRMRQLRRVSWGLEKPKTYAENLKEANEWATREADPALMMAEQEKQNIANVVDNALVQYRTTMGSMGMTQAGMNLLMPAGQTAVQAMQMQQQAQAGMGFAQQAYVGGMAPGAAMEAGQAFGIMTPKDFNRYSQIMNFNPMYLAREAKNNFSFGYQYSEVGNTGLFSERSFTGFNGQQIPLSSLIMGGTTDTKGGQYTGLPWGTNTLAIPGLYSSEQQAGNIFGSDWASNQKYSSPAINALISGGTRGLQDYQNQLQYSFQMQQIALSQAQLDLTQQYRPQFYALEDKSRQLGYQQTEWGFTQQQKQIDLSRKFFTENTAMQKTEMTYNRQFARQDWQYQDQVRDLQWQWKQEDYGENVRFMTGRQRRLAERQMGRDTIMHDLEGDQIQKKRSQQETLWKLEDKRFETSKQQQEEQLKMQEENLAKQKEFFAERKKLEEQQVKLQRQYEAEQMKLQQQGINLQKAQASEMRKLEETWLQLQRTMEDARAQTNLLNSESFATLLQALKDADPIFQAYIEKVRELNNAMDPNATTPSSPPKKAGGGPTLAGTTYQINEYGQEFFRSNQSGVIIPMNPKNPWNATVSTNQGSAGGNTPTVVVINIGNERLGNFVLNAVEKGISV